MLDIIKLTVLGDKTVINRDMIKDYDELQENGEVIICLIILLQMPFLKI